MKRKTEYCMILLFLICGIATLAQPNRSKFNDNWQFKLDTANTPNDAGLAKAQWRDVQLPHDWSIDLNFDENSPSGNRGASLRGGTALYRKYFTLNKSDKEKNIFIDFDGVYMNSTVWINGHKLGTRPFGYISFRYDLTPFLKFGTQKNELVVRVENQQPNSRWYSGGGIYRNVWLVKTGKVFVDYCGTYITTPKVSQQLANVLVQTKVRNSLRTAVNSSLKTLIYNPEGVLIKTLTSSLSIPSGDLIAVDQEFIVENPQLWSPSTPSLYHAVSQIYVNGEKTNEYNTTFGIRYFNFDREKGFFLNGEPTKIVGVCMHHDLGALGTAVNYRAMERQLEILKSMGINGIRTSHNPAAPEWLELCDKMGFIVMTETFDVWKDIKENTPFNYNLYFDTWHKRDITDHVVRDRNHPSIFMWSIGNEIPEQFGGVKDTTGRTIARELVNIVHSLDNRPVTAGLNHVSPENNLYLSKALDLVGINYHHKDYPNLPTMFPGEAFILAESNSALQTRGEYLMPSDEIRRWAGFTKTKNGGTANMIASAYDNSSAPWASTYEEVLKPVLKYPYLSGFYAWTGFDYLGEPTPYPFPARSSYFGIVDMAGFPKDAYYLFQSLFTQDTVLHIFPHWNWEKGQDIDVWAYYNNADAVELFLNGKSLGVKARQNDDLHIQWAVKYEPGTLKAVSTKAGKIVAEKVIQTAGAPAKIALSPDRNKLKADGEDLSFVTVTILNKEGNVVPRASILLNFKLEGDAEIAALDNGLQTDLTPYSNKTTRSTFNGLALAIVKAKKQKSLVTLTVSGEGLQPASVSIAVE
jgi:beta-galactosidase